VSLLLILTLQVYQIQMKQALSAEKYQVWLANWQSTIDELQGQKYTSSISVITYKLQI
jgi:hypothetical protein